MSGAQNLVVGGLPLVCVMGAALVLIDLRR